MAKSNRKQKVSITRVVKYTTRVVFEYSSTRGITTADPLSFAVFHHALCYYSRGVAFVQIPAYTYVYKIMVFCTYHLLLELSPAIASFHVIIFSFKDALPSVVQHG